MLEQCMLITMCVRIIAKVYMSGLFPHGTYVRMGKTKLHGLNFVSFWQFFISTDKPFIWQFPADENHGTK